MNEQERITQLTNDVARWKNRALEAAQRACDECSEYMARHCEKCRIRKIKEEAGRDG